MSRKSTVGLRDAIEQDIVTGRFAPGDRLDEVTLARRFAVSRTPVREALRQLGAAGFVTIQPNRGAFVAEIGPTRLVEMLEVMAELEGLCARLAARRLDPERRNALLEAHRACEGALGSGDADAYYYENEHFHHAIYAASGNTFLAEQARALHTRLKPYRRLQLRVAGRLGTSFAEHAAVVEAILAGEGDLASERLKAHVRIQGERFSDFMAALRDGERARWDRASRPSVGYIQPPSTT